MRALISFCFVTATVAAFALNAANTPSSSAANTDSWRKFVPDFVNKFVPSDTTEKNITKDTAMPTCVCNDCPASSGMSGFGASSFHSQKMPAFENYGPASLTKIQVTGSAKVFGPLSFNELQVLGTLEVFGPLSGSQGTFKTMKIFGPLEVTNVTGATLEVKGMIKADGLKIDGNTEVMGLFTVRNSTFSNIVIYTDQMSLSDSVAQDIIVKHNNEPLRTPFVHLKGNTKVKRITFEGRDGVVILESAAATVGEVNGGRIQKH